MKDKKILFFDIDGTITDEDTHTVPESAKKALLQAKENGHLLFVNTGRPYAILDPYLFDLGFDGFVCGCGTNIYYHGQELFYHQLSVETCKALVQSVHKYKIDAVLEGRDSVYFTENPTHPTASKIITSLKSRNFNERSLDDDDIQFDKGIVFSSNEEDLLSLQKEASHFDFIVRDKGFRELVPLPYSKATGIQFLADRFGLSIDNCYVFGDSNNDLAMLSYVKHSVVMGNASDDLKELAYFVTKDINDDGIAYALEQLKLI